MGIDNLKDLTGYYMKTLNTGEERLLPRNIKKDEEKRIRVWESFTTELPREERSLIGDATSAVKDWRGGTKSNELYPFWSAVAELTGNDNINSSVERPAHLDKEDLENKVKRMVKGVQILHNFTNKYLKSKFGGGIVLYRSTTKKNINQKGGKLQGNHRTLESWTLDPEFALKYKGDLIMRRKISLNKIFLCFQNFPDLSLTEAEYILMLPKHSQMSRDEVVAKKEFNRKENAKWAIEHLRNN